jgi:hypothetical protein
LYHRYNYGRNLPLDSYSLLPIPYSLMISPALHALLARLIDYAGTFPPATLPCVQATANFSDYLHCEHAWMLRHLVVSEADLPKVPTSLDGKLSVLSETHQPRAACIESKSIVTINQPVYAEVPFDQLPAVKQSGLFAKIRTGSVKPEGIPSVESVATFILRCAELKLPFKATAGLHHPVRAEYPLTYEANAPRALMHGFLNVFLAASFAWHGKTEILSIINETDAAAFRFDDAAHWRDWSLSTQQIEIARRDFAHAFGSCSFIEPIQDLQARGWL